MQLFSKQVIPNSGPPILPAPKNKHNKHGILFKYTLHVIIIPESKFSALLFYMLPKLNKNPYTISKAESILNKTYTV